MDRGVGVAVGDVDVAVGRHRHVRRVVEWRLQLGMFSITQREPNVSRGVESHHLVAVAIDQHDQIIGRDEDAVGVRDQPAAPRSQEASGRVEDHDRRLTALKDIDVVVGVDRHVADDAVFDVSR